MKKALVIIAIVMFVLFIGFVGCSALFVSGVDQAVKEQEKSDSQPGGPDNPLEIKPGEAFEVAGFKYDAGWTLGTDALGSVAVEGLKVTNTRDKKDSAVVEIKLWKGTEILAVTDCTTEPIAVGTTTKIDCVSADAMPADYDRITINDTF